MLLSALALLFFLLRLVQGLLGIVDLGSGVVEEFSELCGVEEFLGATSLFIALDEGAHLVDGVTHTANDLSRIPRAVRIRKVDIIQVF